MTSMVRKALRDVFSSRHFLLYAAILFVGAILFSFLLFFVQRLAGTDDVIFPIQIAPYDTVRDWISYRYTNWSGRIFPEVFVYIFSTAPLIIWKILTLLAYIVTSFSFYALYKLWRPAAHHKEKAAILIVALGFPFLLDPGVLFHSSFWVTGSMNYFWIAPFVLVGLYPLVHFASRNHAPSPIITLLGLSCAAIGASSQEQGGAVMVAVSLTLTIYVLWRNGIKQKKTILYLLLFFAVILAGFLVQFLAPGNYVRIEAEIARWLPDLHSLSIGERAVHSLRWTLDAIINHMGILLSGACIALLALFIRKTTTDWLDKVFMLLLCAICAVLLIKGFGTIDVLYEFYPTWKPVLPNALASFILIPWSLLLLLVAIAPSILYRNPRGYLISLLILACFAATLIVTLSPTVYISGPRTLFMPSLLLFLAASLLTYELVISRKSRFVIITGVLAIAAVNYFLVLFAFLK